MGSLKVKLWKAGQPHLQALPPFLAGVTLESHAVAGQ